MTVMDINILDMALQAASEPTIKIINTRFEALDYLANPAYFVEFDLKLVDLAKDGSEARDFSVGHLHCVASSVVLHLGRRLGLLGELCDCQRSKIWQSETLHSSLRIAIAAVSNTSDDQSGRQAPANWWDPGVTGLDWKLLKRRERSCYRVATRQLQSVPGEIAALRS